MNYEILYDFPVSYTFRAYEAEIQGRDLLTLEAPQEIPREPIKPEEWNKRQWDRVQQLESSFLHYQEKVIEYQKQLRVFFERRSSKGKYKYD